MKQASEKLEVSIRAKQGSKLATREEKLIRPTRSLDSEPMMAAMGTKQPNHGFTLVEIMIVIVIIGILMAIGIPAVNRAIATGKQTAIRLEINALEKAVEQYMQKYGDYPPDGSDKDILNRHMRRLFPRMSAKDATLLTKLTDANGDNTLDQSFSATAMDRAEALVFFLGGFSDNALFPITGEGGPLTLKPGISNQDSTDIGDYQYNGTRDNSFFDFDPSRLTLKRIGGDSGPLLSNDEELFGYSGAAHGGVDPLPAYVTRVLARTSDSGGNSWIQSSAPPIVYFDQRSYGLVTESDSAGVTSKRYNGYATSSNGAVRPYKTLNNLKPPRNATAYATPEEAFAAVQFQNPNTFQIISPGLDGIFGALISIDPANANALPVHFISETGMPVFPRSGAVGLVHPTNGLQFLDPLVGSRFQDSQWPPIFNLNGHLDNITNFSTSTLEDDLQ